MALRIKNPYFKLPVEKKAEQQAAALDAWLKTQTSKAYVSIADLKAAFPAVAPDMTREVINQVCANLGLTIENPEDTEA